MDVLLVVESCFGNTAACAERIAGALRDGGAQVDVVAAAAAPERVAADLLIVGAPTHMRGIPTPRSRATATRNGAPEVTSGVGEWLARAEIAAGQRAEVFDTAVASMFSGSAAKQIAKRLAGAGASVGGPISFIVAGSPAVLGAGELERAATWGSAITSAKV